MSLLNHAVRFGVHAAPWGRDGGSVLAPASCLHCNVAAALAVGLEVSAARLEAAATHRQSWRCVLRGRGCVSPRGGGRRSRASRVRRDLAHFNAITAPIRFAWGKLMRAASRRGRPRPRSRRRRPRAGAAGADGYRPRPFETVTPMCAPFERRFPGADVNPITMPRRVRLRTLRTRPTAQCAFTMRRSTLPSVFPR